MSKKHKLGILGQLDEADLQRVKYLAELLLRQEKYDELNEVTWAPKEGEWVWCRSGRSYPWFLAKFLKGPTECGLYEVTDGHGNEIDEVVVREVAPFKGELPPDCE